MIYKGKIRLFREEWKYKDDMKRNLCRKLIELLPVEKLDEMFGIELIDPVTIIGCADFIKLPDSEQDYIRQLAAQGTMEFTAKVKTND